MSSHGGIPGCMRKRTKLAWLLCGEKVDFSWLVGVDPVNQLGSPHIEYGVEYRKINLTVVQGN